MASPPATMRVGRFFLALLALLAVLYAIVFWPGQRHTPKLGIDLAGGIRVVYTAQTPKGSPAPTGSQMSQARQILEDRINRTGVTGSTVVVQGSDQLVVEIPSATTADIENLGDAAVLNFRGLVAPAGQSACIGTSATGGYEWGLPASAKVTAATVKAAFAAAKHPLPASQPTAKTVNKKHYLLAVLKNPSDLATNTKAKPLLAADATAIQTQLTKSLKVKSADAQGAPLCAEDPFAAVVAQDRTLKPILEPDLAKGQYGLNAESCPSPSLPKLHGKAATCTGFATLKSTQQSLITAALSTFDCGAAQTEADLPPNYYVACGQTSDGKFDGSVYLLGHVILAGASIDSASAQAPDLSGNGGSTQWTVALNLGGSAQSPQHWVTTGADAWQAWTSKFNTQGSPDPTQCSSAAGSYCSYFVGFTLNGGVIAAPVTQAVLSDRTSISGGGTSGFSQSEAKDLAQELNYGKLPVSFKLQTQDEVSATLGSSHLHGAFLAGGIGLILVVLYSLLYYRGLGFVTIASLLVSAALTYGMLVMLGKQIGFNLDLAGIAGFIVALGITADSFVVFFERIKDEVHSGRSFRVAVPRAWVRARRTILSADTVSFLAAAILYFFAAADVKGFAFTLGMSTILDLVVVFLFTLPMVSLLSRSKAFGSPRFTGLNAVRVVGAEVSDDEPVARRAAARRVTKRVGGADLTKPKAAVAVLEPDEPGEPEVEADDEQQPDAAKQTRPRRRTTPEPGTAAERAAARRARLRGTDGGDK